MMPFRISHLIRGEPAPAAASKWTAMPGNQLELGATGFRIVMRPDPDSGVRCTLFNPEGVWVASGPDHRLQNLKEVGEMCAASRAEFAAHPVMAWPQWWGRR